MKQPVPISRRVFSYIGDMCLAYLLFYYLNSFSEFQNFYEGLTNTFKVSLGNEYFVTALSVYLLMTMIRFYTTLVFSVSLFEWLSGMRGDGHFLWKRVSGGARVILDFFFVPAVAPMTPAIFGKPTLAEKMTSSQVSLKPGKLSSTFSYLLPLLVVIVFFAPLLQNLTILDGIKVSFSSEKLKKLDRSLDYTSYKLYTSNRFGFSTLSDLNKGRFRVIPSFEVIKQGSSRKIRPYFSVYDRTNEVVGSFKMGKRLRLLELLSEAKVGNPLFSRSFPDLNESLYKNPKDFERKPLEEGQSRETLLSANTKKQISELIQSSFELSVSSILGHSLNHGPFIRGHVNIRNNLLQIIDQGVVPEIDILLIGNHRFLRLKQLFHRVGLNEKKYQETLIPIGTPNSVIFTYNWGKGMKDAIARKDFLNSFFSASEWFFDYTDLFQFPNNEENMSPLDIADYFSKTSLKEHEVFLLEEYTYHYFFEVGREAVKESRAKLKELLEISLSRLILIMDMKKASNALSSKEKIGFSKRFYNMIIELKQAIKKEKKGYFNI